jgi:hypothetical protein
LTTLKIKKIMNYTGNEDHAISLADAAELTARYRAQFSAGTFYIKGEYFGKNALNSLLNQTGCVGARMYYGLKADQTQCLVIVGVDSNGNDMTTGEIMEMGLPCPVTCSVDNALNC